MPSEHYLFLGVNWAAPLLLVAACAGGIRLVQACFAAKLRGWGFTMESDDIRVDEDLPNFFRAIKLSQADEVVKEA